MSERSRERDLVLAPNEYAFISDQTKGNINVYVGPYKTSLANTDQPVYFDASSKRFIRCSLEESTKLFAVAPEGWYIVLKNPSKENTQPTSGTVNNLGPIMIGHKVNLPGPRAFALWPGQMTRVIKGHHIRSNQYLMVRVYDEESARKSWSEAVIKPQGGDGGAEVIESSEALTMGQQLVIKGTEVSFYIPPTGIEVVPDSHGNYVREAVTLERLEYCILLDEDGNKRFIQGPAVVFPEPTERFVKRHDSRKFRAIELNELSGLYVKVITPYTEGGVDYEVGQELFITGKDTMIYFPRPEHAIIRYGERELHYAVAIPAGEGRYCLDRKTGQVSLIRGPKMFLPDPRNEIIVRRVLSDNQVSQWFPGNKEARDYNIGLQRIMEKSEGGEYVLDERVRQEATKDKSRRKREEATEGFAGDEIARRAQFTPPRTITLDTKYDGAITISPWTGYAVQVVSKSGERKVIVGPQTYLLAYDESLESMQLSTGTPKNEDRVLKTVYLRVKHNKVSDVVEAETSDLCRVTLKLSYRVNFEGEPDHWFDVENYVKFLTDHMRSVLRNAIKRRGVQSFYADAIQVIRDTVLGESGEDGKRKGRAFPENGMRIYDVEVLDVTLGDAQIENMLTQAQHAVVSQTLELAAERRELEFVKESERLKREIMETQSTTLARELELREQEITKRLTVRLTELGAEREAQSKRLEAKREEQQALEGINTLELQIKKAQADVALSVEEAKLLQRIKEVEADVAAVVSKANAVSPDLVAALQAFSDRAMVERVSESMAPLAILGGGSVAEVVSKLLKGTALEQVTRYLPDPSSSRDDEESE